MKNLNETEKLELFQVEELESRFEMSAAAEQGQWFNDLYINVSCPQK